jgi:hypothetical protein
MNQIVPVNDIQTMAAAVAKSGLFGVKSADQAMALMLVAQAEGLHPATAARDYHVIQGRPALKADAMLARFQAAGGKVEWKVYTDQCVTGVFSHPQGGTLELSWTLDQAKQIGLASKDNWKNYPRAMLRSRVISEGIRTVYPGCVVGTYTPEEVEDFQPSPNAHKSPQKPVEIDMGSVEVVNETPAPEVPKGLAWALKVPGKDDLIYASRELWEAGLFGLVDRLSASSQLSYEDKHNKVQQLKEANKNSFNRIGMVDSVKIYAEIAKRLPREDETAKKD